MTFDWSRPRLRRIEEAQAKQKAHTADPEHYQFRMACSCPPDKRIHMRGGLMYNQGTYDGWFVDATTVDLTDRTQIGGLIISFNTANYYVGHLVRLQYGGVSTPYVFEFLGSGTEFATAGEAEQDLIDYIELGWGWGANYPLCGLILRNDGNVGLEGAFLPVDPINRGRSYLWPRDWRPRNIAL